MEKSRGGDDFASRLPVRGGVAGHSSTPSSAYRKKQSFSSSALISNEGVGGLDVHSDRPGDEHGEVDGDESGDDDGVERVESEASEDGSGDAGGSWNSSGRSASGTARVRVMKKCALLFVS